jgi:geranylgeranyl reductase family protein
MQEKLDVIVVGAGPGGSAAGMELARAGYNVCIIEKQHIGTEGRYKACGGALAWELVDETKLPQELIDREIQCLDLHHVDGEIFHKVGRGAVVWRSVFDKYLLDLALKEGCKLSENDPLLAVEKLPPRPEGSDYCFTVHTPKNTYTSKFLVAADGVNSPTLKQLGFPPFTQDSLVLTITREIRVGATQIATTLGDAKVHLFFGIKDLIGQGYAWLFPKKETISVGWGNTLSKIQGTSVRNAYQKFLDLPLVKTATKAGTLLQDKPHLIPVGFKGEIARDKVIGVGDAIGAVDPISGKGIPYALLSGQLAARSIKHVEDKGKIDQLAQHYTKAVNMKFGTVLRKKTELRNKIFSSDELLKKYLKLWETHHSSEILAKGLL